MCTKCVQVPHRGHKRMWDPLELELEELRSQPVVLGPLQKQPALLTAEPPPQAPLSCL